MQEKSHDFWRQLDWYNPDNDNRKIVIVGAGSQGSHIAYQLLTMGVKPENLTIIDFDVIELHNFPNQFYARSAVKIGDSKVDGLALTLGVMCGIDGINRLNRRAEEVQPPDADVIISAVDSMAVRKFIWENWQCDFFLDVRVAGLNALVYAIDKKSNRAIAKYTDSLYSDTDATQLPCTAQAVIDTSFSMSAQIVRHYRQYTNGTLKNICTAMDLANDDVYPFILYNPPERIIEDE